MAETRMQTPAAGPAIGADGSKGVDAAVQAQSGDDPGGMPGRKRTLDEVPHQPA